MSNGFILRPAWTPFTILLMILGFVVFWPLGLAMLAYILWGDRIPEIRRHFGDSTREWSREFRGGGSGQYHSQSGNMAFDDYRARELERLEQERRRLEEERREFEQFVGNLRRAKDQEEFDRFMAERQAGKDSPAASQ